MEEGRRFSVLSGGAFDISVQPLWRLYEAHFWSGRSSVGEARAGDILARAHDVARALVDLPPNRDRSRRASPSPAPGMARDAQQPRPGLHHRCRRRPPAQRGVRERLRRSRRNPRARPSPRGAGVAGRRPRRPAGPAWRGAARSAGAAGLRWSSRRRRSNSRMPQWRCPAATAPPSSRPAAIHHIFDPTTGDSARALIDAAVIGPRATVANGLSTALCVAGEARAAAMLAACPGYRAILTRLDGTRAEVGSSIV